MFFVLLLYALFASVFTIAKTGLEFTQPLFFVGSRMALAGIFLLLYQFITKPESFKMILSWGKVFKLAAINIYLTNIFEFWGLKYLTSFKTCLIYSLSPFVSALFSYLIFTEKMSWRKWVGLGIGFLGLLPILVIHSAKEELTGQFFFLTWAEIAVMAAAVSSVYGWILLRQLVKDANMAPAMANGLSMFVGGIFSLIHSYAVEDWNPIPVIEYWPFLECTILLIVISNLICYNLYGALLKRYTATFMSFAGFSTPLFTALFGWIFLGEVVTWPFYLSTAILFAGLLLFYQEEIQSDRFIKPVSASSDTV